MYLTHSTDLVAGQIGKDFLFPCVSKCILKFLRGLSACLGSLFKVTFVLAASPKCLADQVHWLMALMLPLQMMMLTLCGGLLAEKGLMALLCMLVMCVLQGRV